MKQEPELLEILLTKFALLFYGKSVYRSFADRLPLAGGEEVLDFGCGMGTVACYAAEKLPHGHLTCLDVSRRWQKACRKTLRKKNNVTFMLSETPALRKEHFDVVYCHFVLHDISDEELHKVITVLAQSLKPGGVFVFREPLKEVEKLGVIKGRIAASGLNLEDSRVTDIPLMGNALESIYTKPKGDF